MTTTIGSRIRQIQKSAGGTQADFAKRLDINLSSLRNYMMGRSKPDAGVIESLCEGIGVSPDWLILGAGKMFYREEGKTSEVALEDRHAILNIVRSLSPKRKTTVMRFLSRVEYIQSIDATEAASGAFTDNKIDIDQFTVGLQEIEELELDMLVAAAIENKIKFLTNNRKPSRLEEPTFNEEARKRVIAALDSNEEGRSCVELMLNELKDKWRELTEDEKMKEFRTVYDRLPDQNKTEKT